MEDDLVITVIATGFDSESFHQQEVSLDSPQPKAAPDNAVDEATVQTIDMDLSEHDQEKAAEEFASENETNIWDDHKEDEEEDDEDDEIPAFLRRRKKHKES